MPNVPPWAIYVAIVGAGASGVTGVANNASLGRLQDISREEIRVAESRGRMQAQLDTMRAEVTAMMPREGILELHRAQQALIEKLIDFMAEVENRYATKKEIDILIAKMNLMQQQFQPQQP